MDYTELDYIVDNAPDVDIDVGFFSELKTNLQEAATSGGGTSITTEIVEFFGVSADIAVSITNPDELQIGVSITPLEMHSVYFWVEFSPAKDTIFVYCSDSTFIGNVQLNYWLIPA